MTNSLDRKTVFKITIRKRTKKAPRNGHRSFLHIRLLFKGVLVLPNA